MGSVTLELMQRFIEQPSEKAPTILDMIAVLACVRMVEDKISIVLHPTAAPKQEQADDDAEKWAASRVTNTQIHPSAIMFDGFCIRLGHPDARQGVH